MNKILKNLFGIIFIALTIMAVFKYHNKRIANIKENGSLTLGTITEVDDGGEAFDVSATYEYLVGSRRYSRKVEISCSDKRRNFKGCLWPTKDCSGGFAWVLYSKKEPGKSLINLDRIYSAADTSNLSKPISFDGFY